jgi:phosphatidylcholine synthase
MTPRFSALAVHLFTAIGASLAMLALHEAFQQDWAAMALWLALAFVVDGIDGPLARHFDVKKNAPEIDGVLMDLIIDFLTYVVIPAYALYASGLLPGWSGWLVVLLVPFASAVYFADTRMKTADNSFSGFPGCWNMVVLALLVIGPPWWAILGLVIVLTAAMFFPLKFVHPVRTARCWRRRSCGRPASLRGGGASNPVDGGPSPTAGGLDRSARFRLPRFPLSLSHAPTRGPRHVR